jgi:hypothetical protein
MSVFLGMNQLRRIAIDKILRPVALKIGCARLTSPTWSRKPGLDIVCTPVPVSLTNKKERIILKTSRNVTYTHSSSYLHIYLKSTLIVL